MIDVYATKGDYSNYGSKEQVCYNWEIIKEFKEVCRNNETEFMNVNEARNIILTVYEALEEKGYNPINQLVGYLLSGDPTYITSHRNARALIRKLERDEILEELVRAYVKEIQ